MGILNAFWIGKRLDSELMGILNAFWIGKRLDSELNSIDSASSPRWNL
jgi:hypothetical protein